MHEFFSEPRSWVAVAFVIFFVLFGSKLWTALAAMLDKHSAGIRAELEEASRLRKEAERMLADARTRRESALAEARALIQSAHAEAGRVGDQARHRRRSRRQAAGADGDGAYRRRREGCRQRTFVVAAADIAARAAQGSHRCHPLRRGRRCTSSTAPLPGSPPRWCARRAKSWLGQ